MSLSNKKQVVSYDNRPDDDAFHTWHVAGLEQCGSERYIRNNSTNFYSDSFKLLYEQDKKGVDDKFVRIYGEDEDISVNSQNNVDNEFIPFKTGIADFDNRMHKKSAVLKNEENLQRSGGSVDSTSANRTEGETQLSQDDEQVSNSDNLAQNNYIESDSSTMPESVNKRVFEEAYKKGYEDGNIKGYEEGVARGMEEGFQAGSEKGSQEGYDAGFQKGEQEGYDVGFQKGEDDGKIVSDAKALEIITSLEDILQKSEQAWQNSIKSHESKILAMICKIAEKVVFAKVQLDEEIVKNSILNALATMPEPEEIVLNICPDDYDYVEMIKEDFFTNIKSLKSVSVISNSSVQRGGCKIESSKGNVETDIKQKLEQVFTSIMGARVS